MKCKIKIENRGKVSPELLEKTEDFINYLYFELNNGAFKKLSPKLFRVIESSCLKEDEIFGFECTLLFDIFKGRINIIKKKNNLFRILFFKRFPNKGKFSYELYLTKDDISENLINKNLEFIVVGEGIRVKVGNTYLLKNGLVAIVKKNFSNSKIGVIYDEDSEDVEEYIKIEDIKQLLRGTK